MTSSADHLIPPRPAAATAQPGTPLTECTDVAFLQQTVGQMWALFDELEKDAECGRFNHSVFYRLAKHVQTKRRALGVTDTNDGLRVLPETVKVTAEQLETTD